MIREAIILAGGLGTRLRTVVADLPKCMAPVDGVPFLHFIVMLLEKKGIKRFIFSLGYKHKMITDYLDHVFPGLEALYIIEEEQLGTGGAIRLSAQATESDDVFVLNGDTLFNIDLAGLAEFHDSTGSHCSLALKPMNRFDRYGSVELLPNGAIKAFHEKRFCEQGNINGGVYALHLPAFLGDDLPEKFSFEKWLESNTGQKQLFGQAYDNYFIDIGIPGDYKKFRNDYQKILSIHQPGIAGDPSLFFDRFFESLDSI